MVHPRHDLYHWGSFVERGGHTPYEPLAHDCAILHGPSLYNFQPEFEALQSADATSAVQDAQGLATAIISLKDPQMRATQVIKANKRLNLRSTSSNWWLKSRRNWVCVSQIRLEIAQNFYMCARSNSREQL